MKTLRITIPDDMEKPLDRFCRQQRRSAEEAVREIVRSRLLLDRFHELCRESESLARAAGYQSEDEILEAIS